MTQKLKAQRFPGKRTFLYAVCGDEHVERANISLRFLKKFTRAEILVVTSRTTQSFQHDQVLYVPPETGLSDHQMALMLKTGLHRLVNDSEILACYIDTDIVPVSHNLDTIFDIGRQPFAFAADHVDIAQFSRWAVTCQCEASRCNHLVKAIADSFGVAVDPNWQHWNGGVFVFSPEAARFLDCWNQFTRATFTNPMWRTRDQGTLIAAAWKLGLQRTPLLDRKYNFLVDCYHDLPENARGELANTELPYDDSYSLRHHRLRPKPTMLHFVNSGVMRRGWRNWDEAEAELEKVTSRPVRRKLAKCGPLTEDNRVVHGLWIGKRLSRLELLSIHSFLRHGHEFHLWLYDDLDTSLPKGVVLEDAAEILPRDSIFRKISVDTESGVGRQSVGPFSDLFRYKLLHDKGGWWTDLDMTCLRPLNFQTEYVFRRHRVGVVANLAKCPAGSVLMRKAYERVEREANENTSWLLPNRILSETVRQLKLEDFAYSDICNPDEWRNAVEPLILSDSPIPESWHVIHWTNEMWRTLAADGGMYMGKRYMENVPDRENPPNNGVLHRLYLEYGLLDAPIHASEPAESGPPLAPASLKLSPKQPLCVEPVDISHINIMLPSIAVGGAERTVLETLQVLAVRASTANLFITNQIEPHYALKNIGNTRVFELYGDDHAKKLRRIALGVRSSPSSVLFTHLVRRCHLQALWDLGVSTIPVIHNSRPAWQDSPDAFNHPRVPFVVAVSDNVAGQLREAGCPSSPW